MINELEKISFDQKDYLDIHKTYWKKYSHQTISIELTEQETNKIVDNCKTNNVSVNSAILAAFSGGQVMAQGKREFHSKLGVGASLREKLNPPAGESMGFYAGVINVDFKYNPKKNFWKNAQNLHKKATGLYTDKNFFNDSLMFDAMNPGIMESRHYKILGTFVDVNEKISSFGNRDDVVLSLLKRSKTDSVENVIMGTAITNLTRMNFPTKFGDLELDRLIMQPGGGFPLTTVNLVVGVVTCSNKMSIIVEFAEDQLDTQTAEKIKEKALSSLIEIH